MLQTYAQHILDSIQKNGFYVRVPSGKQFYLYVLQTLDRADATLSGTGLVEGKTNNRNHTQTMKTFRLLPLLFLTACSTAPQLTLRPLATTAGADNTAVRHPEIIHAYHVGRYADPNDDLVMHEQHVVYRVEENTRWDFHPGAICGNAASSIPRDAAFSPAPVNDAILAEVNSQRLATAQIMVQARTLSPADGVSKRIAADQNQFAADGGVARDGERDKAAARRAGNGARAITHPLFPQPTNRRIR